MREAKKKYEKGGSSIFKIAKELAIPYSTLQDYIQNGTCVKGRGRKSIVMSDAEEQKVVQFVIKRAELGCGVGWDQLRNIIQEVLISLCNANPNRSSTFEQSGHLPNRSFVRRFAERQNLVLLRTMELSKGRQILTTADLSMWQEHTQERLLGDPRLAECFKDPRRLFNQDETSVVLGSQQRVLAARGTKVLYSTSSGSREHITASFCVSASGGIVPPRIVLRGKRNLAGKNLEGLEIEGLSGQWNFSVAPKGYVVRETMLEIILDLAKYIEKNSIPTPVVLVIDGAQPHISIEAAELCEQYKIQPWLLKPDMSHILQPLDLSFFSSLKKAMSKLVFQWQSNPVHAGQYLNKYTVVHLLREATEKCLQNKSLIAQGFKRAGLFPWDPSKPDKSKLKPSSIYASGSGSPKLSPESERDGVQTDREDSEELRSPLDKPGDSINVLGQCVEGDGHILKLNDGAGDSAEEVEVQVEEGAVHSHVPFSRVGQVCQGLACGWCFATPGFGQLKLCSTCVTVAYCGLTCQGKSWSTHKGVCKKIKGMAWYQRVGVVASMYERDGRCQEEEHLTAENEKEKVEPNEKLGVSASSPQQLSISSEDFSVLRSPKVLTENETTVDTEVTNGSHASDGDISSCNEVNNEVDKIKKPFWFGKTKKCLYCDRIILSSVLSIHERLCSSNSSSQSEDDNTSKHNNQNTTDAPVTTKKLDFDVTSKTVNSHSEKVPDVENEKQVDAPDKFDLADLELKDLDLNEWIDELHKFEIVFLQKSQLIKFEEAFKKKKFGYNHTKFQCWLRLKFASVGTESQAIDHLLSSKLASNVPKRKVKRIQNVPVGSARYDITSEEWKKILNEKKVDSVLKSAKKVTNKKTLEKVATSKIQRKKASTVKITRKAGVGKKKT